MKYHSHIVAIDPDTVKSGVAHLYLPNRRLELFTLEFFELYDYLIAVKDQWKSNLVVLIEGGWLVEKSNYHAVYGKGAQRVAKNVGSNHETGKKIVEMCKYMEIDHEVVRPLTKIWRGPNRKITHDELIYFTGYTSRTSQETRDAALIAWEHAGLPIRILPRNK